MIGSVWTHRARVALLLVAVAAGASGCSWPFGPSPPDVAADVAAARRFAGFPLYWLGASFEGYELTAVVGPQNDMVTFIYGTCETHGDGGCAPPLEIQIAPLCRGLRQVTRDPIWRLRSVRGAPLARADGPIALTAEVQIKAYAAVEGDPLLGRRALQAVRTINAAGRRVGPTDPLPPAPSNVLEGRRPCQVAGP